MSRCFLMRVLTASAFIVTPSAVSLKIPSRLASLNASFSLTNDESAVLTAFIESAVMPVPEIDSDIAVEIEEYAVVVSVTTCFIFSRVRRDASWTF